MTTPIGSETIETVPPRNARLAWRDRPAFAQDVELLIVGLSGGTHIGGSLARAAARLGVPHLLLDAAEAYRGPRLLRSIAWRAGRRPLRLDRFAEQAATTPTASHSTRRILIATGTAPLTAKALLRLKATGCLCINYSTDDPWNEAHRAAWHLRALPHYDVVATPRRSNIDDFVALGCRDVRYLPFAYDDELFATAIVPQATPSHEVLFVGGADPDRAAFMAQFMRCGLRPALVGHNWSRFPDVSACDLGLKDASAMRALTAAATVNLCLVRHANRDGHVMRSFEIPACGGFMVAEDTAEHREIFGTEGQHVLYFTTPQTAADKVRWALDHPEERRRMAAATHHLIVTGRHTYADRLEQMLGNTRG